MIKLKINGKEVEAEPGMTIMEVAEANGIHIPRLCYHKALKPVGSCRLCVVEVKPGPPRPQPACTTQVAENMEVVTHSERLNQYRRQLIQLLLINHPLDCPICDKGGECELQELVRELKIDYQPYQAAKLPPQYDSESPLIERYSDRCVKCERCVHICEERVGASALYFAGRGYRTMVTTGGEIMSCEFCGSCIAVCPVGAIVDKTFRHSARSWELEKRRVICLYCGAGCHLFLNIKKGNLKRVTSSFDDPVTGGIICSRGRFSMNIVDHPERLRQPLIRKDGELRPVSWSEAFDYVAARLQEIQEKWGKEAIGGIGSPRATNESNYIFQKFCRVVLGTPHIDAITSIGHQQIVRALLKVLGRPGNGEGSASAASNGGFQRVIGSLGDLKKADGVIILDVDVRDEMPAFGWGITQAETNNVLKHLIAISWKQPRGLHNAEWLRCNPATVGFVAEGILKALIERGSSSFRLEGRKLDGFRDLKGYLETLSWDTLKQITGTTKKGFDRIYNVIAGSERPVIIVGNSLVSGGMGAAVALADILALAGGRLKVLIVADRVNTQGCSDMGISPDWLPGYRPLSDQEFIRNVWEKEVPANSGMSLRDMIYAAAGESSKSIKALWVMGSDLLAALPDREVTEKALNNLDLLICQEAFLNQTARLADCVLPASLSVEVQGSVTSGEMRVQAQKGVRFVEEARPDWWIIKEVATRLGHPMGYESASEIFAEIGQLFSHYGSHGLDDIPEAGFMWNSAGEAEGDVSIGSGCKLAIPELGEPVRTNKQYPFLLIVGVSLFQSGTLSRYGRGSVELEPEGRVWLHPQDAEKLGISEGARVLLRSEKGSIEAILGVNKRVAKGVVWATPHFSNLPVTKLLKEHYICPVRVEKLES